MTFPQQKYNLCIFKISKGTEREFLNYYYFLFATPKKITKHKSFVLLLCRFYLSSSRFSSYPPPPLTQFLLNFFVSFRRDNLSSLTFFHYSCYCCFLRGDKKKPQGERQQESEQSKNITTLVPGFKLKKMFSS